jgi:hypothetical protein
MFRSRAVLPRVGKACLATGLAVQPSKRPLRAIREGNRTARGYERAILLHLDHSDDRQWGSVFGDEALTAAVLQKPSSFFGSGAG